MGTKTSTPIDAHVGRRLRMGREVAGLTQEKLGEQLGVSFQQVQKYENGTNRISASRLFEAAQALDVPLTFFFEGLPAADGKDYHAVAMTSEEHDLLLSFRGLAADARGSLLALIRAVRRPL